MPLNKETKINQSMMKTHLKLIIRTFNNGIFHKDSLFFFFFIVLIILSVELKNTEYRYKTTTKKLSTFLRRRFKVISKN